MKDKKSLFLCLCFYVVSLVLGLCCYYVALIFNSDWNNAIDVDKVESDNTASDNNVIDGNDSSDDNEEFDDDLEKITINNDKYLWKMKVSNLDGAYVYENGYVSCTDLICERGMIISKLEYGTELNIIGDYVYGGVLSNNRVDYDNFKLDDIKDYYSLLISYDTLDEENKVGYIKYSDLTLIEGNNFNMNEYNLSKKYYVSNDNVSLYNGPGLLYEDDKSAGIPVGEMLEVKYYNQIFSRIWLYVSYENYSGWVMQCRYNSVNEPYSIVNDNCVLEVVDEKGYLEIKQDNVSLYSDVNGSNKIDTIVSDVKISYDFSIVSEPGIVKFHVNYNGRDGFIIGIDSSIDDCDKINDDGKLYVIREDDGSIGTCN